jgi:hypothetical protein
VTEEWCTSGTCPANPHGLAWPSWRCPKRRLRCRTECSSPHEATNSGLGHKPDDSARCSDAAPRSDGRTAGLGRPSAAHARRQVRWITIALHLNLGQGCFDLFELVSCQLHVCSGHVLLQAVQLGRAWDPELRQVDEGDVSAMAVDGVAPESRASAAGPTTASFFVLRKSSGKMPSFCSSTSDSRARPRARDDGVRDRQPPTLRWTRRGSALADLHRSPPGFAPMKMPIAIRWSETRHAPTLELRIRSGRSPVPADSSASSLIPLGDRVHCRVREPHLRPVLRFIADSAQRRRASEGRPPGAMTH